MNSGIDDRKLPGSSLLSDHADGFADHQNGGSIAPVDDLLDAFDIPRADLPAWESTRNMWAGAPLTRDESGSLDHLITVLASLPADLTVHDAIGWICATWSTVPRSSTETMTDVIMKYGSAPGAWVFHAAGIPPEDMEQVAPEAVEIVAILAVARGAHLPPRR